MALTIKLEENQSKFNEELQSKSTDMNQLKSIIADEVAAKETCLNEMQALKVDLVKRVEEDEKLQGAFKDLSYTNAQVRRVSALAKPQAEADSRSCSNCPLLKTLWVSIWFIHRRCHEFKYA